MEDLKWHRYKIWPCGLTLSISQNYSYLFNCLNPFFYWWQKYPPKNTKGPMKYHRKMKITNNGCLLVQFKKNSLNSVRKLTIICKCLFFSLCSPFIKLSTKRSFLLHPNSLLICTYWREKLSYNPTRYHLIKSNNYVALSKNFSDFGCSIDLVLLLQSFLKILV